MSVDNPYVSPTSAPERLQRGSPDHEGLQWILFSFDGRIPRRVFWGASLGMAAVAIPLLLMAMLIFGPESMAYNLFALILNIPMIWISLAIQIKRWHDRDKSGWWVLINLIPIIGGIWAFIETGCLRGTEGPNAYGYDPT